MHTNILQLLHSVGRQEMREMNAYIIEDVFSFAKSFAKFPEMQRCDKGAIQDKSGKSSPTLQLSTTWPLTHSLQVGWERGSEG